MSRRTRVGVMGAGVALVLLASALFWLTERSSPSRQPLHVLFIGNSYSNHHDMTRMVEALSKADPSGPTLRTELVSHMQKQINRVYARAARKLGAELAPVGRAWQNALDARPRPRLHSEDDSHPNPAGSYLTACVLYGTLTGRSPRDLDYHARLTPELATRLQRVAAETVD